MGSELAIQLQIDDIAAVKQALTASVAARNQDTLWWLCASASNIIYENRVLGPALLATDQAIDNINIGSSIFANWFNLHNSYFSQDQPIANVTSLAQAIQNYYRWRVSQYFNDIAIGALGAGLDPNNVYPYPDFNIGTYQASSSSAGTYTKGVGPVNTVIAGPGVLQVTPIANIGSGNALIMSLTAVREDGTTVAVPATIPLSTTAGTTFALGGQNLTASYTASDMTGIVAVASTTLFKVGTRVVIIENDTGTTPFLWTTEVAVVTALDSTHLTLAQPTLTGSTVAYPVGLRNNYTTSATVYPLFIDVNAVTNSNGNASDHVQFNFFPDRPGGFINVSSISTPQ